MVGSSIINQVNNCEAPDVAKVAFYGVEPYTQVSGSQFYNPIFYRTVQHFFTDVNWHDNWEANNDNELAVKMSGKAEERFEKFRKLKTQSQILHWTGFFNVLQHWWATEVREKAEANLDVYYLYHDMGDFWTNIIGANALVGDLVPAIVHHCSCNISQGTSITNVEIEDVNSEDDCTHPNAVNCSYSVYQGTQVINLHWITKPSDGVVLEESAQHMTGATYPSQELMVLFNDTGIANEPNTGSSHMQARNDRNTRDALRALYDGEFGFFFETDVKQ